MLEEFLSALWGDEEGYRSIWFGLKGKPPNKSRWFQSTREVIEFSHQLTDVNVYHACSLFSEPRRLQKHVVKTKAVWLDIDLKSTGFESIKDLCLAYIPLLKKSPFGKDFWLIYTGGGCHVYWIFDRYVTPIEWKQLAKLLHEYCKKAGIKVDPARTRDIASIMRLPTSYNVKGNTPRLVKIFHKSELCVPPKVKTKTEVKTQVKYSKEDLEANSDLTRLNFMDSDAASVAKGCVVIKQFKETGWHDSEPAWHFSLGCVRHCVDGEKHCHEYSAQDPNYQEAETRQKLINLAVNDVGPTLCETFEQFGLCDKCAHRGRIKTPLQLGVVVTPIENTLQDLETNKEKNRAQQLIDLAPSENWRIGREGIFKITDDGTPILLSDLPFYVINLVCEDFLDDTVLTAVIRIFLKNQSYKDFKLPYRYLAEEIKLLGEFCGRGVFPKSKKYLKEYLQLYFSNLRDENIIPHKAINGLGWQADNSFVYSTSGEGISKKGQTSAYITDRKMRGYAGGFVTRGTLEAWGEIIKIYNSDAAYMPHLFSMLCSIGSPLLPFTAAKGIMLSLQGMTGSGKTLAHKVSMGIWGNPAIAGILGTRDSATAMIGRMAAIRHLPVRLDEATAVNPKDLSNLVYELVNGRGRSRAARDGSLSNTNAEWQTLILVTTNKPMLENDLSVISEAERCRILELDMQMPDNIGEYGKIIGDIMEKNYGVVGRPFIRAVTAYREKVIELLDKQYAKYQQMVDSDKRFWASCGAIAFTAAKICKNLKLLDIDIAECEKWFIQTIKDQVVTQKEFIRDLRGFETLEEMAAALKDYLSGHLLVMRGGDIIQEPGKEIKGRIVKEYKGSNNQSVKLYVRAKVFKEFIKQFYMDSIRKIREEWGIAEAKTYLLGGEYVKCYMFELKNGEDKC